MNFLFRIFILISFVNYSFSFNNAKSVLFFPANFKNNLPNELYGNFISKISEKSNFYISKNTDKENIKLINKITDNNEHLCVVSHLSSANNVLNLCKKNNKINDLILINPINTKLFDIPYINPLRDVINFDNLDEYQSSINDILENNDQLKEYKISIEKKENISQSGLNRLVVINSKKNKKWNILPSFFFMDYLNLDPKSYEIDNLDDKEILEFEKYNHFDLLDKIWAKNINLLLNGDNNTDKYDELDKYHQDIVDIIFDDKIINNI